MSAVAGTLASWLRAGVGLVFPEVCQLCGGARATPREGFVCAGCRANVRFIEPPLCARCGRPFEGEVSAPFTCGACREGNPSFSFARSAVVAGGPVLEVVHRYKYSRALWFEPFLGDLLVLKAGPELANGRWDLIVPVPLYPAKERQREFNQAERLARRLSRTSGIPINTRLIRRVIPTRTQTQLSREDRECNVRNAFAARQARSLAGERIVLVDDVFTTGATTNACAKVLIAAGAAEVCVWTVARPI